ncbi:MAG: type II toxin-antitoxin system VapC family toxin [Nanoarchaeota archaeon]
MKCLDTTFLIDLLHNEQGATKKVLAIKNEELTTTSINLFEVCVGIFRRKENPEKAFEEFRQLIGALEILPVDVDSAVLAGMTSGNLLRQGKEISGMDCLIAGAMLAKNCKTIVTRDTEHFQRMKGIRVETY